jgi:ABC-type nitrate/sulfonate/bicarbonate transport system ATPase subunit
MTFLNINAVSKAYPSGDGQRTPVIDNVSLEVGRGELVVFLGPSGCGKTTLMRIVGGLEQADSGSTTLQNQPLGGADRRRGMVFQSYSCFPWLTVRGNIAFALRYRRDLTETDKQDIVNRYLKLVGLADFADFYTNRISGGMRQRVAIARTLAADPDVLLLDEPFGALDALTREHLQFKLLEINRSERKTAIFVTHDVDEAVLLAHTIYIFSARPARIVERVDVAAGIPIDARHPEVRESAEFFALRNRIQKIIRAEYQQSMAAG